MLYSWFYRLDCSCYQQWRSKSACFVQSAVYSLSYLMRLGTGFTQFEQPALAVRVEEGVRQIVPIILWDFEGFGAYAVVQILLMQTNNSTHFHQNHNLSVSSAYLCKYTPLLNKHKQGVICAHSQKTSFWQLKAHFLALLNICIIFHGDSYIYSMQ